MLVPLSDFVPEVPHSMAAEPANTVDAQPVGDWSSARFMWEIENFSKLNAKKLSSEVFYAGGYKWRVLIFPKGNNNDHLSMYLDAADSSALPYGWTIDAKFSLTVFGLNNTKQRDTQHQFNARESDWGFTSFMPLSELNDPLRSYLRKDTCVVEADIAVRPHINNCSHDSKKVVHFHSLEKPKEDEFCLELSKFHNYDYVVQKVSQHLGLDDPSKIRLTSHNCYSQQPKPQPIKYRGGERLSDMLVHYNQTSDILYYEVLDIPLQELQGLKTLKIAFHHATEEVIIHTIRLSKRGTVGDVIRDLKKKVELSHPNAEVRLLEIFHHKIYKIFGLGENIENVNEQYWTLRAEEIPEEEKEIGPQDLLIHVYHFMKDPAQNQQVQNFGEPFFLVIHEGEMLAEVKVRVQKKLKVPDEEFSKWKFVCLSMCRTEYLHDTDIMSTRFQRKDVHGAWEQYLGLEHSDNPPKISHSAKFIEASAEVEVSNTEMALEHGAQFIEASANTEGHNTELALGLGAEAIEASTEAVADVQTDIMNAKVEPTGTVSFERKGPPSVEDPESWRGFPVGKAHASLLHDAEVEHPDFFNDVKYSSARRAVQSLNLFASNLANLASDKHGSLSRDDLQVMRDELTDLERDGFHIRWAIESVDRVFTVCFQLPLQQEITELAAESTHLKGKIEHLQVKTASLKEEVSTLKEKIEHAEKELVVAEKEMGDAELRLNEIASELEIRGRLLAEYNSILH